MFKMKRQWKRIISTIMAALMVVTVIPSSFGSSSAAEIATPGDADQTGYVKIEAKLPESDKKGEDVTGIVYEVYKDASCKDEVGAFVLSCDGKVTILLLYDIGERWTIFVVKGVIIRNKGLDYFLIQTHNLFKQ